METAHDESVINEEVLENYLVAFQEAVEKRDWDVAKAVAADTKDAGFDLAARCMNWDISRVKDGATRI